MRINLVTVLNTIDDVKEHLKEQDYITCMNILRDANAIILRHEHRVCKLWEYYYKLRDQNDFYAFFLEFIATQNIVLPQSFESDRDMLALANEYLCDLDDSDENHDKIDEEVIMHLNNLERTKIKYEGFMYRKHPELIDQAAMYIIVNSGYGYNDFDLCGRTFYYEMHYDA